MTTSYFKNIVQSSFTFFFDSAANKGCSIVNYRKPSAFDRPNYHVMIIVTGGFFKKHFYIYWYCFYFLKILLILNLNQKFNLELVFLEFKPIYKHKEQVCFLFSCSFFTSCFIIILSINARHLFTLLHCVNTYDKSVLFWIAVLQSLYVITLSTFYTRPGSLKWTPIPCQFSW